MPKKSIKTGQTSKALFHDWISDWQLWTFAISMVISAAGYLLAPSNGTVRFGEIGPEPLEIDRVCAKNPIATKELAKKLKLSLSEAKLGELHTHVCSAATKCQYEHLSIGAWFICPDSTAQVDSLTVVIRSNTDILSFVVSATNNKTIRPKLGIDSNSITFTIASLAPAEELTVFIINDGITEAPYETETPAGLNGINLTHFSSPGNWTTYFKPYVLIFIGVVGFFLLVRLAVNGYLRIKSKYGHLLDFNESDIKALVSGKIKGKADDTE